MRDKTYNKEKPWFSEHDIRQRMVGIEIPDIEGMTILDLGCAEGNVSMELINRGAASALGIDFVRSRVRNGPADQRLTLKWGDFDYPNTLPEMEDKYDIVLCLAVLNKVGSASRMLDMIVAKTRQYAVIRTPRIDDEARACEPLNVIDFMQSSGFTMVKETIVGLPWIGVFRRDNP